MIRIPVKIGIHKDWLIAEALGFSCEFFRCLLDQAIPLESEVDLVIMLPSISEIKQPSQKINCRGIINEVQCVSDEKMGLRYDTGISFTCENSESEKYISDFFENLENQL